jgi:PBSX family phage terminase large subunit
MTLVGLKPEQRAYRPYGSCEQLFYMRDEEVVLSGPAGTGKSRGCLEKLHLCALKYPRSRYLILRKTRAALTESGLVTFEEKVVPPGSPITAGAQRRMRQSYHYPNGSEIVIGGMDNPTKIMSTEYDIIYVQEAIELTENDWESATSRLRNGVVPYQQMIADTNPDAPMHWLKKRADRGLTNMIDCKHEDNPVLFDHKLGVWTEQGKAYIQKLDRLTGPRFHRLRHGRWVSAEGMIYEQWDDAKHRPYRKAIDLGWDVWLSIDFGYTNPFVCQWWAVDGDGRLIRYREIYKTRRLVEDHAKTILERSGWKLVDGDLRRAHADADPLPRGIICDHDAEGRATLEKHLGRPTIPAHKAVIEGIEAVQARLKVQDDGRARMEFMRDSLVERDEELDDEKRPCCTEEETPAYVWDLTNNQKMGDKPVKENDHGWDAARYVAAHLDITGAEAAAGGVPTGSTVRRQTAGVWDMI